MQKTTHMVLMFNIFFSIKFIFIIFFSIIFIITEVNQNNLSEFLTKKKKMI